MPAKEGWPYPVGGVWALEQQIEPRVSQSLRFELEPLPTRCCYQRNDP